MNKIILKESTKEKLNRLKKKVFIIPVVLMTIMKNTCYATGSISVAEVETATENVKNAVIKLAMPIRWYFNICKYSLNIFKDYSKFW